MDGWVGVLHRLCPRGCQALAGHARHGRDWCWSLRNLTSAPTSHQAGLAPASANNFASSAYMLINWFLQGPKIKLHLTSRKCCSKWRSCKHCSSLVWWRSQKSSKAVSVSSSWPRSLRGTEGDLFQRSRAISPSVFLCNLSSTSVQLLSFPLHRKSCCIQGPSVEAL